MSTQESKKRDDLQREFDNFYDSFLLSEVFNNLSEESKLSYQVVYRKFKGDINAPNPTTPTKRFKELQD